MRSMMSDSNTMLIANGQRPTPASSPFCVSDNPNSTPHASIENARRMKQKDVATSAAKHTAKVFLASAEARSEEHTSELQSQSNLVCRLLLEKKKNNKT